jgi:hypothetical protein
VGRTTGLLKGTIINVGKSVKKMGLCIICKKTKYMEVTKRPTGSRMLKVDDRERIQTLTFKQKVRRTLLK